MYTFEFSVSGFPDPFWIDVGENSSDKALSKLKKKLLSLGVNEDVHVEILSVMGPWYIGG